LSYMSPTLRFVLALSLGGTGTACGARSQLVGPTTSSVDGGVGNIDAPTSDGTSSNPDAACTASLASALAILATNQHSPGAIAVDSTYVYWTDIDAAEGVLPGTGRVMRVSKCGGPPITLASAGMDEAVGIALDETSIYWTVDSLSNAMSGSVVRLAKDGGAPITLASGMFQQPSYIVVDATNAYWSNFGSSSTDGTVMKMPLEGGDVVTVASSQAGIDGLTEDATSLYWIAHGVVRIAKAGGTPLTLAPAGTNGEGNVLAVDATNVYWTQALEGLVLSVAVDGGGITTLASDQPQAASLAVDATNVYWGAESLMLSVPKRGGIVITLAQATDWVEAVAADGNSTYWATSFFGREGSALAASILRLSP
jgi:hypothetical protein